MGSFKDICPCTRDCENRSAHCRRNCSEYLEYEEAKKRYYDRRKIEIYSEPYTVGKQKTINKELRKRSKKR